MATLIRDSAIDANHLTRGDELLARQHIEQMIAERGAKFVLHNLVVGTNIADLHEREAFLARRSRDLLRAQRLVVDTSTYAVAFPPLAQTDDLDPLDFVRTIAVARITMPTARVRLSAGRQQMSDAVQALCFLAGANSIFYGEQLLTTGNPEVERDRALLDKLGMYPLSDKH